LAQIRKEISGMSATIHTPSPATAPARAHGIEISRPLTEVRR
jgi:hypothetical protein